MDKFIPVDVVQYKEQIYDDSDEEGRSDGC